MKDFIPYNEALELKHLGFDEPCFRFQNNISYIIEEKGWLNWNEVEQFVSLPTFSQSFRFFREKYDLQCWIHDGGYVGKCCIKITGYNHDKFYFSSSEPMEYEEAELDCLKGLIELVKQKQ
jgi:hypothetical protein